ncbi:helix-turn-helix domain-containing protein [Agrobacterium sp. BT-220-3]|nr:helix-turn-helix domain-containing protein [Agrobacterium sp. BT-220-3]
MNEERLDLVSSERWCLIPSHVLYEASSLGRIRRASDQNIIKCYFRKAGYAYVCLMALESDGTQRKLPPRAVHRLVLEAFEGPCPPGMETLHLDDNPSNNTIDNLQWNTRAVNVAAKRRPDRLAVRQSRYDGKHGIDHVEICTRYKNGSSLPKVAKVSGCGIQTVKRVLETSGVPVAAIGSVQKFDPIQITDWRRDGLSAKEIADRLGCTLRTVFLALSNAGLTDSTIRHPLERDAVKQLHLEGLSNKSIGEALGCDPSSVYRVLATMRKEGLIDSERLQERASVDGAKVRELAAGGMNNKQIAAELNVSEASVSRHRRKSAPNNNGRSILDISDHGCAF